jgi:hypothetical protein
MSKSRKKVYNKFDDYDEYDYIDRQELQERRKSKRLRNLIRSKNVNGLVEMDDDELDLQWSNQ